MALWTVSISSMYLESDVLYNEGRSKITLKIGVLQRVCCCLHQHSSAHR